MLHPFRAVQQLNQRLYTNLRVALEQRKIELPVSSRIIQSAESEDGNKMMMEEKAIYLETDALQFEMGNIVAKQSASGNVLYDVPRSNQHKDRYSSLAMAVDYISELEKESVRRHKRGKPCIGLVSAF